MLFSLLTLRFSPRREKQPPPRLTLRDLQNRSSSGTAAPAPSALPVLQGAPNPPPPLPSEVPAPATLPKTASTPPGSAPGPARPPATTLPQEISLANITVPLESIKPSEPGGKWAIWEGSRHIREEISGQGCEGGAHVEGKPPYWA